MKALNTNFFLLPTKLSPLLNLLLYTARSLFNPSLVLAPHLSANSLDYQHFLLSKSQTTQFFYASPHLWNQLWHKNRIITLSHPTRTNARFVLMKAEVTLVRSSFPVLIMSVMVGWLGNQQHFQYKLAILCHRSMKYIV